MNVRDVMTANPATCSPDTGLEEVARLMKQHDTGAIPVVEGNRPVGIVTDRDMVVRLVAEGNCPLEAKARQAMTESPVSVKPGDSARDAARVMKDKQIRRVLVQDGDKLVGIVSQADIALKLSDQKTGDVVEDISQPN